MLLSDSYAAALHISEEILAYAVRLSTLYSYCNLLTITRLGISDKNLPVLVLYALR